MPGLQGVRGDRTLKYVCTHTKWGNNNDSKIKATTFYDKNEGQWYGAPEWLFAHWQQWTLRKHFNERNDGVIDTFLQSLAAKDSVMIPCLAAILTMRSSWQWALKRAVEKLASWTTAWPAGPRWFREKQWFLSKEWQSRQRKGLAGTKTFRIAKTKASSTLLTNAAHWQNNN